MLGVLALSLLVSGKSQKIPRIVQLPAALILLALLQSALGLIAYFDQALLYASYLLFALFMMVLGARLREIFGIEKLFSFLAIFLLIGAELSALIGVAQHYQLHTLLDRVIVVKTDGSMYGNLAQRNQFANYTAMGLISLGLLFSQRKLTTLLVLLLAIPLLFALTLSASRSSWLYLVMMVVLSGWAVWRRRELRPLLHYSLLMLAGFALMHAVVQLPFMSSASGSINTLQRFSAASSGADATGGVRLYLWHEAWLIFTGNPWLGAGFGQFAWQHFQLGPPLHRTIITGLFNNAHNLIFQLAAEAGIAGLTVLFVSLGVWLYGLRRTQISAARWWAYAVLGVLAIHSLLEYPLWYAYFMAIAAVLLGGLDEAHWQTELNTAGRVSVGAVLLLGLLSLFHLNSSYLQLRLALRPVSGGQDFRRGLDEVGLFTPYADLFMSASAVVSENGLTQKLARNSRVMRFIPVASLVYKQAFLLAQSGRVEDAKDMLKQAIWSYPQDADARKQLVKLAEKDPAHFAALLEFALRTEQEYASAIHNR